MCVFSTCFDQFEPFRVYIGKKKKKKKNKRGCQTDTLRGEKIIITAVATAQPALLLAIHAANCLLIPKAIISSCLLVYVLTSLFKGTDEDCALSRIISLLPKRLCWHSARMTRLIQQVQSCYPPPVSLSLTLKQYELSL